MRLALALSLLLAPALASASASVTQFSLDLAKPNAPAQIKDIQAAVSSGTDLTEMSVDDRKAVLQLTDKISDTLASSESVDSLAADAKTQVLADQAKINELLAHGYAESRQICEYVAKVGTNRRERSCVTVAAHRREYDSTQNAAARNGNTAREGSRN